MELFPLIITIATFFSVSQSEKIRIQPKSAPNLCATNEQTSISTLLKLAQCGKVYPAGPVLKGSNVFTKVPVDNVAETFQLKTDIPDATSQAPPGTENCLYVKDVPYPKQINLQIFTAKCDSKETNQHWKFEKIENVVQWVHKKTIRCIRAGIFEKNNPTLIHGYLDTEQCISSLKNPTSQYFAMVKVP